MTPADYSNRGVKARAWQDISAEVDMSGMIVVISNTISASVLRADGPKYLTPMKNLQSPDKKSASVLRTHYSCANTL